MTTSASSSQDPNKGSKSHLKTASQCRYAIRPRFGIQACCLVLTVILYRLAKYKQIWNSDIPKMHSSLTGMTASLHRVRSHAVPSNAPHKVDPFWDEGIRADPKGLHCVGTCSGLSMLGFLDDIVRIEGVELLKPKSIFFGDFNQSRLVPVHGADQCLRHSVCRL